MPLTWIEDTLVNLREQGLFRSLRTLNSGAGAQIELAGKKLVNLASNDYLDLASHPKICNAVTETVKKWGWGSGASQHVSGYTALHNELAIRLATFENAEDAVLFPTGFQANIGTITALVRNDSTIIMDKLCHASIVDGARLSQTRVRVYPHKDLRKLKKLLEKENNKQVLVITDSVFSMDGDIAPLTEIVELCRKFDAMLLVDEAHGTGVLGKGGRGALELCATKSDNNLYSFTGLIRLGTLSKALGGIGGFVVGSKSLCDLLRNCARSAIYTTNLPPAAAAASIAALKLIEEEPWRREHVCSLASMLRGLLKEKNVKTIDGPTPIIPIIIGEEDETLAVAERLLKAGFLCPAIRPPTVAKGTSRIRISLTAGHNEDDVYRIAEVI